MKRYVIRIVDFETRTLGSERIVATVISSADLQSSARREGGAMQLRVGRMEVDIPQHGGPIKVSVAH